MPFIGVRVIQLFAFMKEVGAARWNLQMETFDNCSYYFSFDLCVCSSPAHCVYLFILYIYFVKPFTHVE